MKNFSFTAILLALLCMLTYQASAQNQRVVPTHPRILLSQDIITKLQSRRAQNTVEWQQLQARVNTASNYQSHVLASSSFYEGQHYLFALAMSYYASGNTTHRDTALAIFRKYFERRTSDNSMRRDVGYDSRSVMVEVATAYDWLYNFMPDDLRTAVRTRLVKWADSILYNPITYGRFGSIYFYEGNNYCLGHLSGITTVAYAIYSEDTINGNRLLDICEQNLPLFMNYANTRLKNGDANEGWSYGAGYAYSFFRTLATIKTASYYHTDKFLETTYDEDAIRFLAHATLPEKKKMLAEGDWARESSGSLWDFHRFVSDLISSYSNDEETRRIARFWSNENIPLTEFAVTAYRWVPFLFTNQEEQSLDYRQSINFADKRIYTDTSGTGQLIQRTSWNQNTQWITFRAGGRWGDHAHDGPGHFSIYENGWLLIDNNIKSTSGIEGADSMHNCIHFEGMNADQHYPYGGYEDAEHSAHIRREFNNKYSYIWSDNTPIYTARFWYNTVDKYERQFFYLPDLKSIVTFDIAANRQNRKKWFGFNFNDTNSIIDNRLYTYSNGTTKAFVHTLYPLETTANKAGRMIRIANQQNQTKDYFVHLTYTKPNAEQPYPVTTICRGSGFVLLSDLYGVFIQRADTHRVVLFTSDDETYRFDSLKYIVPTSDRAQHYIIGLQPSTDYYITSMRFQNTQSEIFITTTNIPNSTRIQSSEAGILQFTLLPGTITIIDDPATTPIRSLPTRDAITGTQTIEVRGLDVFRLPASLRNITKVLTYVPKTNILWTVRPNGTLLREALKIVGNKIYTVYPGTTRTKDCVLEVEPTSGKIFTTLYNGTRLKYLYKINYARKQIWSVYNNGTLKDIVLNITGNPFTQSKIGELTSPCYIATLVASGGLVVPTFYLKETENNNNDSEYIEKVSVFPNPAHSELTLILHKSFDGVADISIYDIHGNTMLTEQTNNSTHTINTSIIPNGQYILKVENNTDNIYIPLTIIH